MLLSLLVHASVQLPRLPFIDALHRHVNTGLVFLELKYVFNSLQGHGLSRQSKLYDWQHRWSQHLRADGWPADYMVAGSRSHGHLRETVIEIHCFIALLCAIISAPHGMPSVKTACVVYVMAICEYVVSAIPDSGVDLEIYTTPYRVSVHDNGLVDGWSTIMGTDMQLVTLWESCMVDRTHGRRLASDHSLVPLAASSTFQLSQLADSSHMY